jgi:hypothetical protein
LRQYSFQLGFHATPLSTPNVNQAFTSYRLSSPLRQSSFLNLIPRYVTLHSFPDPPAFYCLLPLPTANFFQPPGRSFIALHFTSSFRFVISLRLPSLQVAIPTQSTASAPHKRSIPTHIKKAGPQSISAHTNHTCHALQTSLFSPYYAPFFSAAPRLKCISLMLLQLIFPPAPKSSILNPQSSFVNRQSSLVNRQSSIVNRHSPILSRIHFAPSYL